MFTIKKSKDNMKSIKSIAIVALLIVLFTSCNKRYTCSCGTTQNGTFTELAHGEFNTTKSKAQSECDNQKSALVGAHPSVTCTLN
jgi:hypothetical protein